MLPAAVSQQIDRLLAARESEGDRVPVIAVAGPVASGKTTLASSIAEAHGTESLSTDEYLPDYALIPRLERDEPRHADLDRLAADLASLRSGAPTTVPIWSFFENRRADERVLTPGRAAVVEGLFALHPALRDVIDFGVLVDGPRELRRDRFVRRSAEGERGFTVEEAAAHFDEVAEPTFWRFESLYREMAAMRLEQDGVGGFRVVESRASTPS